MSLNEALQHLQIALHLTKKQNRMTFKATKNFLEFHHCTIKLISNPSVQFTSSQVLRFVFKETNVGRVDSRIFAEVFFQKLKVEKSFGFRYKSVQTF
jgi:hypothetical protein